MEASSDVVFVTSDGTWVRGGSSEFYSVLGDIGPDYDASLYAIKNFGFVLVRILEGSLIHIELHPTNVTTAALLSIKNFLSSIRFNSFRISYFKDNWTSEIVPSTTTAIWRLLEICALEGVGILRHESPALVH